MFSSVNGQSPTTAKWQSILICGCNISIIKSYFPLGRFVSSRDNGILIKSTFPGPVDQVTSLFEMDFKLIRAKTILLTTWVAFNVTVPKNLRSRLKRYLLGCVETAVEISLKIFPFIPLEDIQSA